MTLVKVLEAHCSSCGTESYGFRVNVDEDGNPILGSGYYDDLPSIVLPYPVVVPMNDAAPLGDTYVCELCSGTVLVAMEAVTQDGDS